jgi:MoaA/NifB/PqqE/SkfB family radical SAM enzyme
MEAPSGLTRSPKEFHKLKTDFNPAVAAQRDEPVLSQITITVTHRCDFHCQHCIQGFPRKREDFPIELLDKLPTQAMPFGARHVCLTGGEPHLHPEFPKLVEKVVGYGYSWNLITHGYRAEPYLPLMRHFREKFTGVGVSIDGSSPALHDELRGRRGAFEKASETVRRYIDDGYRVEIKSSLNQKNKDDVRALVELAEKLGAKSIRFAGTIPTPWNRHLVLTDDELLQTYQQILSLQEEAKINVIATSALFTHGGVNFCPALNLNYISINQCGEFTFCCDVEQDGAVIGSLREQGLSTLIPIWLEQSTKLQANRARQIFSGEMMELFDTCNYCNLYFKENKNLSLNLE